MVQAAALFISHGSPAILLENWRARAFLVDFGAEIPKPRAILVASAHFETGEPVLTSARTPETIYDFRSPHEELYQIEYPAPGAPELAREVRDLLKKQGLKVTLDHRRGRDHGVWVPMLLMYPKADIPVIQISIQTERGPGHHLKLGQALRQLRDDGVMVVGSGSATHNLDRLYSRGYAHETEAPQWVIAFSEWVHERVEKGDISALLNYREIAPFAVENHPGEEHFLPLFVAAGAGASPKGRLVHASHTYGVLAMDAYQFD